MHDGKMNKQNSNERSVNATTLETTTTTDPASSTTEVRQSIVIEVGTVIFIRRFIKLGSFSDNNSNRKRAIFDYE